jgi:hypothetical protein
MTHGYFPPELLERTGPEHLAGVGLAAHEYALHELSCARGDRLREHAVVAFHPRREVVPVRVRRRRRRLGTGSPGPPEPAGGRRRGGEAGVGAEEGVERRQPGGVGSRGEGDAVVEERAVPVRQREEVVQPVELDHGLVPRQRPPQVVAHAHHGRHGHVVLGDRDHREVAARELDGAVGAGHEVRRRAGDADQRLLPDAPRPDRHGAAAGHAAKLSSDAVFRREVET